MRKKKKKKKKRETRLANGNRVSVSCWKLFYKLILYLLINCGFYRGNEFVILIVSQFLYGFQQVLIYYWLWIEIKWRKIQTDEFIVLLPLIFYNFVIISHYWTVATQRTSRKEETSIHRLITVLTIRIEILIQYLKITGKIRSF